MIFSSIRRVAIPLLAVGCVILAGCRRDAPSDVPETDTEAVPNADAGTAAEVVPAPEPESGVPYEASYALIDHLASIRTEPAPTETKPLSVVFYDLGADRRPALYQHPASEYRFPDVPAGPGKRLALSPVMHPKAWETTTDGVSFQVECRGADGGAHALLTLEVSPAQKQEDRIWHDQELALDACSAPTTELLLRTTCGPHGNCDADWAAWGNPRVRYESRLAVRPAHLTLLISIDSLRPDHASVGGYERDTTPALARLAADSVVFETAVSAAPWTVPSHGSIFTSKSPRDHGATQLTSLSPAISLVSEVLATAGWQTAAFIDTADLSGERGFSRGFQHYDNEPPPPGSHRRTGPVVREHLYEWLARADERPTFAFWQIVDAQGPYGAPAPFGGRYRFEHDRGTDDPRLASMRNLAYHRYLDLDRFHSFDDLVAGYDEGIAFVDDVVGQALDTLRLAGLYDDALIVVTAGHGESLLDHGVWVGHGIFLSDDEIRVPLIVKLPKNANAGTRVRELVSQIDIAPTLLEVLELPPHEGFDGESLLALVDPNEPRAPRVAFGFSNNSGASFVRTQDHKLISGQDPKLLANHLVYAEASSLPPYAAQREMLFDLQRDPHEQASIASSATSGPAVELRSLLEKQVASSTDGEGYDASYRLVDALASMTAVPPPSQKKPLTVPSYEIARDKRLVLYQHPASEYRFRDVPSGPGRRLALAPVMNPAAWESKSDGVGFEVECRDTGGESLSLLSFEISPAEKPEDRIWHDRNLPLDACSAPTTELVLRTTCGPNKNCGADWAAWGDPRVLYQKFVTPRPERIALLISIDTLRPDHLSVYGYERETSPELARLAADGIVFETTVATAPWTVPSHAALLTSTPERINHATSETPIDPSVSLVSEVLAAAGWQTAGFVDSPYLAAYRGFGRGFGYYDDAAPPTGHFRRTAGVVRERIYDWLARADDRPTFAFWHVMDVHGPYGAPAPFGGSFRWQKGLGQDDGRLALMAKLTYHNYLRLDRFDSFEDLVASYDEGIAYTDHVIGGLLDTLRAAGLYDNALIIVTSDHGESLLDHGVWVGHGLFLTDDEIRVPLIVKLPGGAHAGKRVRDLVSQLDIAPTVLEALGLPQHGRFEGESLLPLVAGNAGPAPRVAFGYSDNTGASYIRTQTEKYIAGQDPEALALHLRYTDGGALPESTSAPDVLYQLARDPHEQAPVALDAAATEVSRLASLLVAQIAEEENRAPVAPTPDSGATPGATPGAAADPAVGAPVGTTVGTTVETTVESTVESTTGGGLNALPEPSEEMKERLRQLGYVE